LITKSDTTLGEKGHMWPTFITNDEFDVFETGELLRETLSKSLPIPVNEMDGEASCDERTVGVIMLAGNSISYSCCQAYDALHHE
jgi:hypothetical protein